MTPLVIDTNVFVSAMLSGGGAAREVIRRALTGRYQALFGNALLAEYLDVLGRPFLSNATTGSERLQVLSALLSTARWVPVYYGWRPNLPDEADNHLIELAIAGNGKAIVTYNLRDIARGELHWRHLRVIKPADCLREF